LVKDENDYLLADSHRILNRWKNYLHTAEPSPSAAEIAIAKLKKYNSPGSDQILAELIPA
jgi:hypothetical protein